MELFTGASHLNNSKAIIFDLGGVIEKINPDCTTAHFAKLGVKQPERIFSIIKQDNLVDQLETGHVGEIEFINQLKNKFEINNATHEQVKEGWCAMLLGIDETTVETLKRLREKYKLFLLSNTNEMHYQKINSDLGFQIENLFDQAYFSFMEGKRKPDIELFSRVVQSSRLEAQEIIFMDDLKMNPAAAKTLGLQTLLYETNYPLSEFVSAMRFLS